MPPAESPSPPVGRAEEPVRPAATSGSRAPLVVALLVALVAFAWAGFTGHVWEDYYITYRASKNLAEGEGLTFTPGERVHSFTSPLGTLLPALASLLTLNKSDAIALWLFRLMSITALAGAAALLWRTARSAFPRFFPALLLLLAFGTEAKTLDFSTNGMETGFVLLFLAWTLYALFAAREKVPLQLGLAWAGMMWSRPDSFIYIGALAVGALLFRPQERVLSGRWELLKLFVRAGLITTAVYLPWLLWAWWYYGSPVPHTVIAKGLAMPRPSFGHILQWLQDFPFRIARTGANLETTFMPTYAMGTGWPGWAARISYWLSVTSLLVWLVPIVKWPARVASFAFLVGQFYLNYFSNTHAPWYLPTVVVLALLALAGLVDALMGISRPKSSPPTVPDRAWVARPVAALALLLPAGGLALTVCSAHQMRLSQQIVEDGNRRRIGEWLKAHAATPRDTVFVECLGYVGYFSNLKIYDFPGLGSPEVVAARRTHRPQATYVGHYPDIILDLEPDWLVLRSVEAAQIRLLERDLLSRLYRLEKVFDVTPEVQAVKFLPGRGYLLFDARFEVYRRDRSADMAETRARRLVPVTIASLVENQTWAGPAYDSNGKLAAHAPSRLVALIPDGATRISGAFGFFPGAYENHQNSTPGGLFSINVVHADGRKVAVYSALLNPRDRDRHRGDQAFDAAIPAEAAGARLEFLTEPPPGGTNAYGWTYWTDLKFEIPRQ